MLLPLFLTYRKVRCKADIIPKNRRFAEHKLFYAVIGRSGAIKKVPKWKILGVGADNRSTLEVRAKSSVQWTGAL